MKRLLPILLVLFVLKAPSLIAQSESILDASDSTALIPKTPKSSSKWDWMLTWTPLASMNLLNPSIQMGIQKRLTNNSLLASDLGYVFDYSISSRNRRGMQARLEFKYSLNSEKTYQPEKYLSFAIKHRFTSENFSGYYSANDNFIYEQYFSSFRYFNKTNFSLNYGDIIEVDKRIFIDISLGLGLNIIHVSLKDPFPPNHSLNNRTDDFLSLDLNPILDFGQFYTPSFALRLKIGYKLY